ncbi:DNA cytosine methyltransferase [Microvirga rosea]|uniref:DNA cytosine methyltransferase n=1 Tax=Microvirga rosea TaxID=2715425 RepID=UPI001D0B8300|nr:DNA cytosine methyltransferase [Microvirga rosea]MCB8821919.1 DNA cytosine methyltransferase [Microvirga rosea]
MPEYVSELQIYKRTAPRPRGRTCVDLFSGAGGLAVGFRQAGWAILAANDADRDAGETFRLNFPEATFFEGAISQLTAEALLEECGLEAGELDCLIGGPPCQSFSYNNHNRSADDERARLFEDYLRLVEGLKPKTLIMENVPGILTIGNRSVINEIFSQLALLGYESAVRILSAEEFGTPQIRRRVFIVGSRVGKADDLLPEPTHKSARVISSKRSETASGRRRPVTVGQAIGDLPPLANGGGVQLAARSRTRAKNSFQREVRKGAKALYNHICQTLGPLMLERIQHVPEGGNWRNIPRDLLTAGMQRAELTDHTKRYGRLSRKGLASTILTKCDPHWGAYIHPTQDRVISVREAARLQGFPDAFVFAGQNIGKQYMQVGNAVPAPIARAIAEAALKHIERAIRAERRAQLKVKSKLNRNGRSERRRKVSFAQAPRLKSRRARFARIKGA